MDRDAAGAAEKASGGDDSDLRNLAFEFLDECASSELDLVAVTDHHSIEGYGFISPYLREWQDARDYYLSLLPGLEITFGDGAPVHALVIFGDEVEHNLVERYITTVFDGQPPFDQQGNPVSNLQGPHMFARRTRDILTPARVPYLVIPAHVDSHRGIRTESHFKSWIGDFEGSPRQRAFAQELWSGFQLRQEASRHNDLVHLLRSWLSVRRFGRPHSELREDEWDEVVRCEHWPLIVASDPHDLGEIGSRYTWLKMDSPSLEGVRLALLDPESRLRLDDELEGQPVKSWIREVSVRDTEFFDDLTLPISPDLNTLIGGRGTGKSMVIELIRYAFGLDRSEAFASAEGEVRERVDSILKTKDERDYGATPGVLLPGHRVRVAISVDGGDYVVERTADGIEVRDGEGHALDVELAALMAPRVLSQREIAETATAPAAQRRELDRMVGLDATQDFRREQESLIRNLSRAQSERAEAKANVDQLRVARTKLKRVKDHLALLERVSEDPALKQRGEVEDQRQWLDSFGDEIHSILGELGAAHHALAGAFESEPPSGPSQEKLQSLSKDAAKASKAGASSIAKAIESFEALDGQRETFKEGPFEQVLRGVQERYDALMAELAEEGVDIGEHESLTGERSRLDRVTRELGNSADKLRDADVAVSGGRQRLIGLHRERFEQRVAAAQVLVDRDADVRIEVVPFGERAGLEELLSSILAGSRMRSDDFRVLARWAVQEGGEDVPDRIDQLTRALTSDIETAAHGKAPSSVMETETGQLVGATGLSGYVPGAFERAVDADLSELEKFLPEDRVITRARRGSRDDFVSIAQGSVGQRATAILSLLLAGGHDPLILDQPEDDLDNQYVYGVVVDLLRKTKSSRQLVVATHNANIPVNGDAEAIIEMTSGNRFGRTGASGSIDRFEVKEAVSRVMEGSAEAFRLRRERYGY